MQKFFVWLGGIIFTILLLALVGVVIYNNVPAVKERVDGWLPAQEQEADNNDTGDEPEVVAPEDSDAEATAYVFENDQAIIRIG